MPKQEKENENLKRAEDYINSMIGTMMSISAVLATISVMALAIIANLPTNLIIIIITACVLISVIIFLVSFYFGIKSHGTLILALLEGKRGFKKAQLPTWKYLRILFAGLVFLGIACALFFVNTLMNSSIIKELLAIKGNIKMTQLLFRIANSISYLSIIFGSIGMILFATRFPLSSSIKDLELAEERILGLNGYQVWKWSWVLILSGATIQLIIIWMT
jgi:hypothetical protein